MENYDKVWLSGKVPSNGAAVLRWYACTGKNGGEISDQFPVTNGVKKGYALAQTQFSMVFSAMLIDAFHDGDDGIPIRHRFNGKLFKLKWLQAKSKVQTEVLDECLFADDMAKGALTEEKMQKRCKLSI